MLIDILHVAFRAGGEGDDRVDQIFTIEITVHQQFPAGLFNTLATPAWIIRVGFTACAGEDNLRVVEVCFADQVEACRKRFGESHVRDRAAVGESAQRRLQRICKAAGFDDHISALLAGQFLNFKTDIGTDWVQAVVCTVTAGDLTAMFNRIDTNNH